ncbi:MAG TPA: serine hydrolase domain-containing protein [Candidatus Limnocylindrales bacterium]|nr:serine hydrolase domain-containing protein [Candidatus Limnocylindrales bacterium]
MATVLHQQRLGHKIAMLLCALAFLPLVAAAQNPTAKQIGAIFSGVTSAQEPGLAVAVRKDGRTAFIRGYGLRDLRSKLPINEYTNFRLASLTKQFTAMAIMLLVHDGKLRYNTRLTDVFPEFPAYGHTITIRNLLNHTSGLAAYEDLMDKKYAGKSWEEIPQISDAGVLALMEQQTSTKFPSGTKWEYSNSGYCVLAMVVEKISGMAFADFLHERIFAPLKMDGTVAHVYGKDHVANRAYGYTNDAGVWLETDQSPTSATLGDGGIYTSVHDMIKWDDALRNHTLLSAAEMRPAITPETTAPVLPENIDDLPPTAGAKPLAYGFGWFLDPYRGHARMWHYGSSIGFHTMIQRFTGNNLTIIILSNRSDLDLSALALRVADLYFSPEAQVR